MILIADQDPDMKLPAGHRAGPGQGGKEKPTVVVVLENRLTPQIVWRFKRAANRLAI